jgi:hypothetical protein
VGCLSEVVTCIAFFQSCRPQTPHLVPSAQETLDSVVERAGELPPEESAVVAAVRQDMLAGREKAIQEVATLLKGRHTRDLMKAYQVATHSC